MRKIKNPILGSCILYLDNLIIQNNKINSFIDGNYFDYNDGVLLHTITFFSLPNAVAVPPMGNAHIGSIINLYSKLNNKIVRSDETLPVSFGHFVPILRM